MLCACLCVLCVPKQESLQALLVDIHEDPDGFTDFVEVRNIGWPSSTTLLPPAVHASGLVVCRAQNPRV